MKQFLGVGGLLIDVTGAILLAIPALLNTRQLGHQILTFLRKAKYFLYGPTFKTARPDDKILTTELEIARNRLFVLGVNFALFFVIICFRLIQLQFFTPTGAVVIVMDEYEKILMTIFVISLLFISFLTIYLLASLPRYTGRLMIWISIGKREKKISLVGLGFLGVGFLMQAASNLMP